MKNIKNYLLGELEGFLSKKGHPKFCGRQIFNWLYQKRIEDFTAMTDISREGRDFLKKNFYFSRLDLRKREISSDDTQKLLFGLGDKNSIETVFIPEKKRNTLCVSTQVGCKFKCAFCLSGQNGFRRNLETAEIINQYLAVADLIAPLKITNIVFMGIGEPLDNFLNTVKTIRILMDSAGIGLGRRRICISTCGLIPSLKKLADLRMGVKLSLSLNTPDNARRSEIMPVNKKHPLPEVIKAARFLSRQERYPITFEYALLRGYNTREKDAEGLARLLRGMRYKLNLIPLNCAFGRFRPPQPEEIAAFTRALREKGVFFTIRKPRGSDISAACGQLRADFGNEH